MKIGKTNAMRILDGQKISYEVGSYDTKDGKIDGLSVAEKLNEDPEIVYKTLVTKGQSGNIYVFVVPSNKELDLKKGAKACGEKKIDMVPLKDIQKLTGYVRGGCSPVGMKKEYVTFIDESALRHERIIVSGGKVGIQIKIKVNDLQQVAKAKIIDVVK